MGVVIALVTMVVGLVFLEPILNLMGATAQVMPYAKVYSGWLLIGSVFSIINMVFNNLMRTEGAAKRSMQTLIIGALINIVLDPIFMFDWGLGMGLGGAAAATVVSQAASTVFCLFYFGRKKSTFTINRATLFHKTSEDATIVKEIFKVGAPVLMMQMLSSIAFGILNSAAGVYGAAPLASLGIVNKIYMIVLQIIMGYVQAFLPFTAYNIGAKQYGRVKEALSFSLMLCGGIGLGATILFQLFPEFFVSMFSNDPEVLVLGVNCLRAQTYLLLPLAFIQTMTALFQASGKAKEAGILSIGRQGVFLIPLVIVLPTLFANNVPSILEALVTHPMEPGLYGVMFAQPIADVISMILCLFLAKKTFGELNQKVAEKEECLQEQRAY
ncbi:MAG: MATE family efflux transporter, partial [Erysipelotrichaceae bacterium]